MAIPTVRVWTLVASLLLVLSAEARQAGGPQRLDALWAEAGRVTDAAGAAVSLASLRDRLTAPVWLVRVQAAWCGTCQWHADWTPTLSSRYAERVSIVDVIVADEDNAPADETTVRQWRERAGAAAMTLIAEPTALASAFRTPAPLPRLLIVDSRTWRVETTLANPDPDRVVEAIDRVLGRTDNAPSDPRVDGLFTTDQWALIEGMRLPAGLPADPSNRFADDPLAADLGFMLFFEKALSPAGIACSNCHNPDHQFAEQQNRPSYGTANATRNVPAPVLLDRARWLFWDGRADSVWGQALMPIEDQTEMGSSRLFVAHVLYARYRPSYEAVFGPMPDLDDELRFPRHGRPGTPEWAAMRPEDQETISRVLANVGKALAAFERGLPVTPTPFDRYAGGDLGALSPWEKDGLAAFLEAGCAQCHFGPRLSNDAFHNLRFPSARPDGQADRGRIDLPEEAINGEFSRASRFSDAPAAPRPAPRLDRALGAFRTPGLRGVASTMPYGHGGGFDTLGAVIEAHRVGGLPADSPSTIGEAEPWPQGFDPALIPRIVRFLNVLRVDLAP